MLVVVLFYDEEEVSALTTGLVTSSHSPIKSIVSNLWQKYTFILPSQFAIFGNISKAGFTFSLEFSGNTADVLSNQCYNLINCNINLSIYIT